MSIQGPGLLLTTSPFLKDRADTAWIMWQVNFSLVPIVVAATWYFGLGALLVLATSTAGAVLTEGLHARSTRKAQHPLKDGSAVITGVLLGLTLPPGIPLWMAFVGGVIAIALGKLLFGGIGTSVFNPALVGRAFLQASFPAVMTTWAPQGGMAEMTQLRGDPFALPLMHPEVDAITTATPLSRLKFDGIPTALADLFTGAVPGSLGETSAMIILLCGGYLVVRGIVNWRIPLAVFLGTFVTAEALHWSDPAYAGGLFHLFSGGLMLGALYMATDPVTSPITQAGCWVFGVLIGVLVVVIRVFGGLSEGIMFAILILNAFVPIINRVTQPRSFGTRHHAGWLR